MPESLDQLATSLCEFTDRWVNHPLVRARISCHETRDPACSLLRKLPPLFLERLQKVATAEALQTWDKLSANAYWGMKLIGLTLRCTSSLPFTSEEVRFAAELLLQLELESEFRPVLWKLNSTYYKWDELSEAEHAIARSRGYEITDETWYDPGDQVKINPLFCL